MYFLLDKYLSKYDIYTKKNSIFFTEASTSVTFRLGSWKPHKLKNQLYHNKTDLLREQRFRLHPTFSSESYKPLKKVNGYNLLIIIKNTFSSDIKTRYYSFVWWQSSTVH